MQRRNSKQSKSHQLSIVETGFGKRSNASQTREERIDAFIRMVIMRNFEEVKTAFADDDFGGLPKARQVGKASGVFRSPYQAYTGNDTSRTTEYADSTTFSEAVGGFGQTERSTAVFNFCR